MAAWEGDPMMMTVTAHDRAEWLRMADAVEKGGAASLAAGLRRVADETEMELRAFDAWKETYRAWLVFGDDARRDER